MTNVFLGILDVLFNIGRWIFSYFGISRGLISRGGVGGVILTWEAKWNQVIFIGCGGGDS